MTVSNKVFDISGNQTTQDGSTLAWDAMTNSVIPAATRPSFCAGTGTPTFSATKGTLYLNLTGSSATTRAYINTDGATTWTSVTTAG